MKTRGLWALTPTPNLSVRQRCEILGVNRSHLYYKPKPMDNHEVTLMNEIHEIYGSVAFVRRSYIKTENMIFWTY